MEPFYFRRYDQVIGRAETLKEMKSELERLNREDPEAVKYHIREGHISIWLKSVGYPELATKMSPELTIEEVITVVSPMKKTSGTTKKTQSSTKKGPQKKGR